MGRDTRNAVGVAKREREPITVQSLQTYWKRKDPITAGWLSQVSRWLSHLTPYPNGWINIAYQLEKVIFKICPQVKWSVDED